MKKAKKHAAPLRCRLEVWLRGPSPSCSVYCRIGNRGTRRRKCQGCKENNSEAIRDGIAKAFANAAKQASAMVTSIEAAAKAAKEAAEK